MAERVNPELQPISPGHFTTEAVHKLSGKLTSLSYKWDELGLALGLPNSYLQGLYPQEPARVTVRYLNETLQWWLNNPKSASEPNTVQTLVEAVNGTVQGMGDKLLKGVPNQVVTIIHLGELCEKIHEIAARWRVLGRCLQVPEYELDSICLPPDHHERMVQVLFEWVKQKADEATLARLCYALESKRVGEKDVSYNIKQDRDVISLLSTD